MPIFGWFADVLPYIKTPPVSQPAALFISGESLSRGGDGYRLSPLSGLHRAATFSQQIVAFYRTRFALIYADEAALFAGARGWPALRPNPICLAICDRRAL